MITKKVNNVNPLAVAFEITRKRIPVVPINADSTYEPGAWYTSLEYMGIKDKMAEACGLGIVLGTTEKGSDRDPEPRTLSAVWVDPDGGGDVSLKKMGLVGLKTWTVSFNGSRFYVFEGLAEDMDLGPGLELMGSGVVPIPPMPDTEWLNQPDKPAQLPDIGETIPADEGPNSTGPLQLIDFEQVATEPDKVHSLLVKNAIHTFVGKPESGKSLAAMAIAGQLNAQNLKVVYFDAEGNTRTLNDKAAATKVAKDLFFPYNAADGLLDLSPESVRRFNYLMETINPDLVIFDNVTDMLSLANITELDANGVSRWYRTFPGRVTDLGGAALVLDHPPQSGGKTSRGSAQKQAAEDVIYFVTKTKAFDRHTIGGIRLDRSNDSLSAGLPKKAEYRIGGTPFNFVQGQALTDQQRDILDCLENGMTSAEWFKAAKGSFDHDPQFYRATKTLLEAGYVFEDPDGRFYRG